jgi:hypothetical protein
MNKGERRGATIIATNEQKREKSNNNCQGCVEG